MGGRQLGGRIDSTSLNGIQLNSLLEVSTSHFGIFVNLDYLTDVLEVVRPDEANWLDSFAGHLIARPYVVLDSPPISKNAFLIKALLLLKRKPGMRVAEFQDH